MRYSTILGTLAITAGVILGFGISQPRAEAGDWSISLWGGHPHHYYHHGPHRTYYHGYWPRYYGNSYYYPGYSYNPVERRDVYQDGGYAPDGTRHSETTVEDRHSSYYSPGRNQAITRPRTSVQSWDYGPGQQRSRERTSWIGADGRPHSTTIDRNTYQDRWGNSHTDTNVTLKKKQQSQGPSNQTAPEPRRENRAPDRPKFENAPVYNEGPSAPAQPSPGARAERGN